jgi:hypothetical protein
LICGAAMGSVLAAYLMHRDSIIQRRRSHVKLAAVGLPMALKKKERHEYLETYNYPSANWSTFDHIVWITMTSEGPRIANLMLDGIHSEDVRLDE